MQKVTVIIPCYNVEAYIAENLDSVLAQGDVVECVYCVDNGSSDGTLQAIERWRASHPSPPVHVDVETRRGASAARNRPLGRVTTEWIQFLDADDLLLPEKLSRQVRDAGDADVIYERSIHRAVDGSEWLKDPESEVELGLISGNLGITSTNLWRTAKVKEVNGWDPTLSSSQEYDLLLRIYEARGKFKRLDGARTVVRERNAGQISQSDPSRRWRNLVEVQVRMLRAFRQRALHPDKMKDIHQAFFGGLRLLYPYDAQRAWELWDRYLRSAAFEPRPGGINTKGYLWAYRLLGFRGAERMKTMLAKTRRSA